MSSQKSKRKRRNPQRAPRAAAPRRKEHRAERQVVTEREQRRASSTMGVYGERPPSPFGGVPVSEIAIFAGLVAVVVWYFSRGKATLIVGLIVCTLGVLEVTAREHFSGYRSHTTLLAAIPSLALGIGLLSVIGVQRDRAPLLLAVALPVFALLVRLLRARFRIARQARIVQPPRA